MGPTQLDDLLYRARIVLHRWLRPALTLAFGVVSGYFVNLSSDPSVRSAWDVVAKLAPANGNPLILLPWLACVALVALPLASGLLEVHHRKRGDHALLARALKERVDPALTPFLAERVVYGTSLALQIAPRLEEGWLLREIEIRATGDTFVIPGPLRARYDAFVAAHASEDEFAEDAPKLALVHDPAAFTDAPVLRLEVANTRFTVVQFYRRLPEEERLALVRTTMGERRIAFANSLSMHAVIRTRDGLYLVTQRSPKVSYFPGAWSVSLEEQLAVEDLSPSGNGAAERWAVRLAKEELGITHSELDLENARARAVFLECNIPNAAIAVELPLDLSRTELDHIIEGRVRNDYEFTEHRYCTLEELAAELRAPRPNMHPTAGLRMLLTLAAHKGSPQIARAIFRSNSPGLDLAAGA